MADNSITKKQSGFLKRLRQDQSGNIIAIMAAAIIPTIGLAGGAVDMGRLMMVRTKLQAACDAGVVMGRKVQGSANWSANNYEADTQAKKVFDLNFKNESYGTNTLTKSFVSNNQTGVSGTASVKVPMTLMKALGETERTIEVNCSADQAVPNTDVMFVLDTTGSMGDKINDSDADNKITTLKRAAFCFYETLAKQDVTDVTPEQCGNTANPTSGIASDVSLRFGFVPYSQNVNVGKILPLSYIANEWTYQSRQAIFEENPSEATAIYGREATPIADGSRYTRPDSTSNYSNTQYPTSGSGSGNSGSSGGSENGGDDSYTYNPGSQATSCTITPPPNSTSTGTGGYVYVSQNPNPLVPNVTTTLTRYYYTETATTTTEYRYVLSTFGTRKTCTLQRRVIKTNVSRQNYSTTTPIGWSLVRIFRGWDYKPMKFNVSGLKNTATNGYNSSISLPIGSNGSNRGISWNGCIQERKTARVNDDDPSDNWDPIPDDANDMNIDMTPDANNVETQWGPALKDVLYERYEKVGTQDNHTDYNYDTDNDLRVKEDIKQYNGKYYKRNTAVLDENASNAWIEDSDIYANGGRAQQCAVQAQIVQKMSSTAFAEYVNKLSPDGWTNHDIGLLWGARLMSPTGIFANHNNSVANGDVQRHMIFMTDGDTTAPLHNYSAYGLHWWDRKQNAENEAPTQDWLIKNIDARTQALCSAIRGKNINLWVISFGKTVNTASKAALRNCAGTDDRFFEAEQSGDLIQAFKDIAQKISNLRLTE